jgi:hypothetical protein
VHDKHYSRKRAFGKGRAMKGVVKVMDTRS